MSASSLIGVWREVRREVPVVGDPRDPSAGHQDLGFRTRDGVGRDINGTHVTFILRREV